MPIPEIDGNEKLWQHRKDTREGLEERERETGWKRRTRRGMKWQGRCVSRSSHARAGLLYQRDHTVVPPASSSARERGNRREVEGGRAGPAGAKWTGLPTARVEGGAGESGGRLLETDGWGRALLV